MFSGWWNFICCEQRQSTTNEQSQSIAEFKTLNKNLGKEVPSDRVSFTSNTLKIGNGNNRIFNSSKIDRASD